MAQEQSTTLTDTPVDLSVVYTEPGRYLAQVRLGVFESGVLYATAETAPADYGAYFVARGQTYFTFCVDGVTHTWALSSVAGAPVTIAVNRYAD